MGLFSKKKIGREERLARAGRARAKGRLKAAVAEYRKALEEQPNDPATHSKIAPLLARLGDFPGAWASSVAAGERYFEQGFVDKALAVYLQAAEAMPWHPKTWKAVARMHLERERRADAFEALVEGRRRLRKRSQRPEAIELLKLAVQIDPTSFEARLDLARLMRQVGRVDEARELLDALLPTSEGAALRRVRREYFALAPSPTTAWRWLRAASK